MKVKSLASAIMAITVAATSVVAMAADQGKGVITFKGSIIDAPCSIAQESQYQTIEMNQVANVALKNGGKSSPTPFKIELRGCDMGSLKSATATFTGSPASNPDLLAIKGTARGASLAIADHNGELIKLGSASPAQTLSNGDTFLSYSAYLQGDTLAGEGGEAGTPSEITPGDFETFANFTLAYQ
ncbi:MULTISPECIES: fimbrial protein [Pseudomonas]|uniref:Fimbrial protein n=1 Tax=Pseudomonas gessardii TaxID=78544 RepID=A0ABS9FCM4_9PSED|nr:MULTISPECIES: fimbrial protein [Pseudomonas]MBH3423980.1 fimbrial protein [Pseudomonas gessardii]MCF4991470.1 fimbrial protein [Pseudomonas gessardii]MCF5088132.1 fimbrial protein [Pseudomonas gessardii]MCF5098168.1 fimbrial protein [Pseudomonas gessardii]MCF5109129.1 fimbrial protein [Pseudomonas gessardii]